MVVIDRDLCRGTLDKQSIRWCQQSSHEMYELCDARGIFCAYVCDECIDEAKRGYRPEIFTDSQYETDETIEPEDY
jgi:hypothetical protein